MKSMPIAAAFIGVASLVLCQPASEKTSPQELIRADLQFGQASASRGLAGWLSFHSASAAILPARGPIVKGITAIKEFYARTGFTPEGLTWMPIGADVAASGDLGYTYGTWEFRGEDAHSRPIVQRGTYATVWRREPDSSWRVAVDIGSPQPPETTSAQ